MCAIFLIQLRFHRIQTTADNFINCRRTIHLNGFSVSSSLFPVYTPNTRNIQIEISTPTASQRDDGQWHFLSKKKTDEIRKRFTLGAWTIKNGEIDTHNFVLFVLFFQFTWSSLVGVDVVNVSVENLFLSTAFPATALDSCNRERYLFGKRLRSLRGCCGPVFVRVFLGMECVRSAWRVYVLEMTSSFLFVCV